MVKLVWTLPALAVVLTVLLLSPQWPGGHASTFAQGNVHFDIDPNVAGNTGSTIGTGGVEHCLRVDGSGGFDGSLDHAVDVVVQGDTQAPNAYDAWVTYYASRVHVLDGGTDGLVKLPGAGDFTTDEDPGSIKSSDGQLGAGAVYQTGGSGTAGDGTILRIGLDIDFAGAPAIVTFYFAKAAYRSASGAHSTTIGVGLLAINTHCPPAPTTTPTPPSTPLPTFSPTPSLTTSPSSTASPTPTPASDVDGDTLPDSSDNCPLIANQDQADGDSDGIGEACNGLELGVPLVQGWNHVCYTGAVQAVDQGLSPLTAKVQAAYRLNDGGGYDRWFPGRPDLSTMDALRSYDALFILMSGTAVWAQQPSTAPASASLAQGWNSVCYVGDGKSPSDATAAIAGRLAVLYVLGTDQSWTRYAPGRPEVSNIDQLWRYDAALALVTDLNGATWAFEP